MKFASIAALPKLERGGALPAFRCLALDANINVRPNSTGNDMPSGQVIRIVATDPASVRDFQAFARQTGNALIEHGEADGTFWFLLRRR